jgi:transcriptional regulator with XRE-family HTH domain
MLGAMVREARMAAGKSIRQSANWLGIGTSTFSSYEHGRKGVSLPELELLAYAYRVPLASFWSSRSEIHDHEPGFNTRQEIALRQRLIGAQLRQRRLEADLTIAALADSVGFPNSRLSDYERGQRPIPLPELEVLADALGHDLTDYLGTEGPVGDWIRLRSLFDSFDDLPQDMQQFVTDPANRPYLRLAMELSRLPGDQLRTVSRTIDEITP